MSTASLYLDSSLSATGTVRPVRYFIRFGIGDMACVKHKAAVGIVQKIYIKEIRIPETANNICPLYRDTMNGFWNDNELIYYDDAVQMAEAYLNQRINAIT